MSLTIRALTRGEKWTLEEEYTNGLRYDSICIDEYAAATELMILRRRAKGEQPLYALAWRQGDLWICPHSHPYDPPTLGKPNIDRAVNTGMGWRPRYEMLDILEELLKART